MKIKKALLSVIACALTFVIVFAFTACNKDENNDPEVTAITLDIDTLSLNTSESQRLTATVTYSDETTKNNPAEVEWLSSSETVATVTKGVVAAKAKGEATITAKIGEISATCTVSVTNLEMQISETSVEIEKGETKKLTAKLVSDGVDQEGEIEWSSTDESVATVDADGTIHALTEGTATVTATRKGGIQSASCEVTVVWENKPVGYAKVEWAEQNKLSPNTWGYWNAQSGWGLGIAEDLGVFTEDYVENKANLIDADHEYIGMGKVTFEYQVTQPQETYTYQVFYRSSDNLEGGKLAYNHVYELVFKIECNVSGPIYVNPYDDVRAKTADESDEDYEAYLDELKEAGKITDHEFELVAGEVNEIRVIFRHDDCGYIYKSGVYDNMGSAIHMQLGELEGVVSLTAYDFQYKDLGEAEYPVACNETKHKDYVDPNATVLPTHPTEPEKLINADQISLTSVTLTEEDGKAIYNLAGTVDLTAFDSVDEAKQWLHDSHFDMQQCGGSWTGYAFERVGEVTVDADGAFLIKYDITYLGVDDGGTGAYSSHFTKKQETEDGYKDNVYRDVKIDEEGAVPGASVTVGSKKYSIVNVVDADDQANNWGCVSIKVETVD